MDNKSFASKFSFIQIKLRRKVEASTELLLTTFGRTYLSEQG